MTRRSVLIIVLSAILAVSSCKDKIGPQPFPMPKVPAMISSQKDYANYLVSHFWQPFFSEEREYSRDTSLIGGVTKDAFSQAFINYATMLFLADTKRGLQEQEYLMEQAEKMAAADPRSNFFETITSICDAYLYNPNSPLRNEEMYIPVEEAKLKSQFVSDDDKAEAAALLPRLKLNRVGTPAADFTFTLRSGSKMDLYDVKADNTIMFFSNPGCEDCKAVIDQLMSLQGLNEAIADGKLAVVNVYPDEDLKEWFAYAPVYPDNWYNGFDQDLAVGGGLYNLRAIPSLYLLDKDKKVIFKDVDPMMLTDYLQPVLAGQPSSSTQSSL
ncbi:MAG: DUF5106 domain-containing protein, partial [Bacteroidales bacterium]|nr:DUF5106 domain-containing protein [Bacteroidales bacterium]MBR5671655.1 DUF5106 domain-containing protein [Bacteroidales bacterium]